MADTTGTKPSGVKRKRDFFDDEGLSDVIIKFGDKQVFAHKVILAKGSVWFEKAFMGRFSEANKNVIELHDDASSDAVMAMLKHLYGITYGSRELGNSIIKPDTENAAEIHLSVFMLGNKYDVSSLRNTAGQLFSDFLEEESEKGWFCDETILVISKLLAPHAPQLADQDLIERTTDFVMDHCVTFVKDKTFCRLLADGDMLHPNQVFEFLATVGDSI